MQPFVKFALPAEDGDIAATHGRFDFADDRQAVFDDNIQFDLIGFTEHFAGLVEFRDIQDLHPKGFAQNTFQRLAKGFFRVQPPPRPYAPSVLSCFRAKAWISCKIAVCSC